MGLIVGLGEQVIRKSFKFLNKLKVLGYDLNLAVNISQRQMFSTTFVHELVNLAREAEIETPDVTLEVTETISMFEGENIISRLKTLSQTGFRISIDDFGTGYSSLAQVHMMPVDELKIDLAFTSRVETPDGLKLIHAIAHMAEALGLKTVAEGVENEDQASLLRRVGINQLQGYLYGKPMNEQALINFLKKNPHKVANSDNFLSKN